MPAFSTLMTYAVISLGGKQHRVQEGQWLLVDRLPHAEGETFHPDLLLLGGDGEPDLEPKGVQVTARVVEHTLGVKVRIGKYRPKSGYKRHNGYRSRLTRIEIEAIGKRVGAAKAEAEPVEAKPKEKAPPKPKAEVEPAVEKPAAPRKTAKKTEATDGA